MKASSALHLSMVFLMLWLFASPALAQNGDQTLDGIGETGLVARYIFKGDIKDWSRNNLHATYKNGAASFVKDKQFGEVVMLPGQKNASISLPEGTLSDMESISISCWVYLPAGKGGGYLFDFGTDSNRHFYLSMDKAGWTSGLKSGRYKVSVENNQALEPAHWQHLVVVADMAAKSFQAYLNAEPAGHPGQLSGDLTGFLDNLSGDARLHIGSSINQDNSPLAARLHDFRIYRIALTSQQVGAIYTGALNGEHQSRVNQHKMEDDLPRFAKGQPELYNQYLTGVEDVSVTTQAGDLPRLPSYVKGTYRKDIEGPLVRVIWPTPTDNSQAAKAGTYTLTGQVPGTELHPKAHIHVVDSKAIPAPALSLVPFGLDKVRLDADRNGHPTKFIENRDKFITVLAKTDPNSFLYMFRHAFGRPQPAGAEPLGVWDSKDCKLRGHATGHYLSALAQAYASTGYDPALQAIFRQKMTYMVEVLDTLAGLSGRPVKAGSAYQADPVLVPVGPGKSDYNSDLSDTGIRHDYWNWGVGFISAYPPDQFIMLEKGAKYGTQPDQIWAPYYTLHKILAGLLEVYKVTGNKKALHIAKAMGDWVYDRLSKLPQQTLIKMWNTYIAGEYGGMNDVMAGLYEVTGEKKYLKTAQLFDNIRVFYGDSTHSGGLAKNVDLFRGLHANQHIPQIVGSIETYRATGDPDYYKIADNFWYKAVNDYMYSIGGVAGARNPANAECFISQPSTLYENGFSAGGQNETCATYNMLKLTDDLFMFGQDAALMDYYERALYNDILASVAENSPANTYHIPLRPASRKQFGNADMTGFTCCNGTALESSTKLQNSIYFKGKDNQSLYVNLYIPSTLDWADKQIKVVQSTSFPYEDQTDLTIQGKGNFDLYVRVPGWAKKGFTIKINGKVQQLKATPGTYVKLSRSWKDGDRVTLIMPFQFHLDPVMDQPNIASLFYGPVLLAAQETEPRTQWRDITLDPDDLGKDIKGDPRKLRFEIGGVPFKPFYDSYERYSVYLNVHLKPKAQ